MDLEAPPSRPPPPPPKKFERPKITLQIPDANTPSRGPPTAASVYYPSRYHGKPPTTPGSHVSDPHGNYLNPFMHMYQSKASEFMFKQFEGFKDFTMNTAKSGLSAGEKSAFWFVNKLRLLSKKWFTHIFLTLCLVLYSVMGGFMFMALEAYKEFDICEGRRAQKVFSYKELIVMGCAHFFFIVCRAIPLIFYLSLGVYYILCQSVCCFVFCT